MSDSAFVGMSQQPDFDASGRFYDQFSNYDLNTHVIVDS